MGFEEAGKGAISVSCSICLEDVTDCGDRAWAKLQCGHQFHLDCIGSAFNVKGVMQCSNCRKVEKGQWLYADGCRPYPEINIDELVNDEDVYDQSYPESSMWCPFGEFSRLADAFDSSTRGPGSINDARAWDQSQPLEAYVHQPSARIAHRSNTQVHVGSSSDQTHVVYYPSSARGFHDAEASMLNPFHHVWESDSHPHVRDPFHQPGGGSARPRYGSVRVPSHSQYFG